MYVHEIIRANDQTVIENLKSPKRKQCGAVKIYGEQSTESGSSNLIHLGLEGSGMTKDKKIFFRILKKKDDGEGSFVPIYKSEIGRVTGSGCIWKKAFLSAASLIKDDTNRPFKIDFYNWLLFSFF